MSMGVSKLKCGEGPRKTEVRVRSIWGRVKLQELVERLIRNYTGCSKKKFCIIIKFLVQEVLQTDSDGKKFRLSYFKVDVKHKTYENIESLIYKDSW